MTGRITNARNTIATAFSAVDRTTPPTVAEYEALNTGISTMKVRRIFSTLKRAFAMSLRHAPATQAAPVYAVPLVDQTVATEGALSYAFASGTFTDADNTMTYSAALEDGSALPAWLTFTPGTRTFSGTAPTVIEETVLSVRVTATDIYGVSANGTFTITITVT